ncbi:hypothetical protein [Parasphingorhabdus sp.]|uniref:hypothetical protein n=1 Tax=Parasphingorhabdus sp. TaxID=2709688 RepID=UPI003C73FD7F
MGLIALTAGCVQATRHSNTMIFGTNTTLGFKVGQNVNQVPEIMLAYDRQEAVIMPLVANTSESNSGGVLNPCNLTSDIEVSGDGEYAVHPCSLVAWNGKAQDSYSVLASFGADFGGQVGATEVESKSGLAQYFATGIAAQILAAKGGAALVSTGAAATESAVQDTDVSLGALFGNEAAFKRGVANLKNYDQFRLSLVDAISNTADDRVMERINAFEAVVPSRTKLSRLCDSKSSCVAQVSAKKATIFKTAYSQKDNQTIFDEKLKSWASN